MYTVNFWMSGTCGIPSETFTSRRAAAAAIAEYVRDTLDSLPRLRSSLVRQGSAYRDGSVTVRHKAGGREFGAYILD